MSTRWLDAGTAVITVAGEVDAASANLLSACASGVLSRARRLVLDLGQLEFFGAEGLSELVRINELCRATGVRWVLVDGPAVARLLRLHDDAAGLATAGTLQAAVAQVCGRRRSLALVTR